MIDLQHLLQVRVIFPRQIKTAMGILGVPASTYVHKTGSFRVIENNPEKCKVSGTFFYLKRLLTPCIFPTLHFPLSVKVPVSFVIVLMMININATAPDRGHGSDTAPTAWPPRSASDTNPGSVHRRSARPGM